jgi:hypothetical protein
LDHGVVETIISTPCSIDNDTDPAARRHWNYNVVPWVSLIIRNNNNK